ncbi:MAG: tRNA preQ1(34) S-adenosylmethionine ribosyltransferase-isomerase QueA, partial [Acidobacteria bacterium]|nr:tRNA preQ1(34) S-adenosylmethionine ribosyltransferase-isomerase QueA [Acidobacteriota bacterium]
MHISDFEYHLPPELIAQRPAPSRDQSRMLILDKQTGTWRDSRFTELPTELEAGTVVVINDTRVFPARLMGRRKGHRGKVEILLLRVVAEMTWEALVRPGRVMGEGTELEFGEGLLWARIVRQLGGGRRLIEFACRPSEINSLIDRLGIPPLPPYIRRPSFAQWQADSERYQTIYAQHRGAIAAPTAGLHFTDAVFAALQGRGIDVVALTHHVGYATFQPVRGEEMEQHQIEAEEYHIPQETAARINQARQQGRPILAVGTTTVRALESAADAWGYLNPQTGTTDLFIYPGYRFRVVDALLTNFHLPQSTLLMLVCAFAGREQVLRAYQHAVTQEYRFYSYGDCMLITEVLQISPE